MGKKAITMRRTAIFRVLSVVLPLLLASTIGLPLSAVSAKKVVLTYVTWGNQTETDLFKKYIIPRYEALNPNIKVNLQWLSYSEYTARLLAQWTAGKAPDLITLEERMTWAFSHYKLLADLKPYVKRDKLDLTDYLSSANAAMLWGDKLLAMPMHLTTGFCYLNKALLKAKGINYPSNRWDWNDMLEDAKKLTSDTNGDGKPDIWGAFFPTWQGGYGPFLWGNGGAFFDKLYDATKCTAATDEAVEAMQFYVDMMYKAKVMPEPSKVPVNIFGSGKVAIYQAGSWEVPTHRSITSFDWDVQINPLSPRTGKSASALMSAAVGISSGSKRKAEAWQFLKFLQSEFVQRKKMESAMFVPIKKSQAELPEFFGTNPTPLSARKVFVESASVGRIFDVMSDRVSAMVSQTLSQVFNNQISVKQGMKTLATNLDKQLASERKK